MCTIYTCWYLIQTSDTLTVLELVDSTLAFGHRKDFFARKSEKGEAETDQEDDKGACQILECFRDCEKVVEILFGQLKVALGSLFVIFFDGVHLVNPRLQE